MAMVILSGCASSSSSAPAPSSSAPKHGGSLTVLEGSGYVGSWPGLDPATHRVRSASFILPASEPLKDVAAEAIKVREGQPHRAV